MDSKAMYKLSYGLFVLTAAEGDKDNGCIINTLAQVASEPNLLSISVNKANYTNGMIARTGLFNASVISEAADFELFKHFGFQSGRDVNKFADFSEYERAANGVVYVKKGTNAFFSCKVRHSIDLGSHTLFIADVTDMEVLSKDDSATYAYYHANIKPKPKAAPPVEEASATKTIWRCTICGYEYEGEELPADFICPWCKHPASDFEKVVVPV